MNLFSEEIQEISPTKSFSFNSKWKVLQMHGSFKKIACRKSILGGVLSKYLQEEIISINLCLYA